MATLKAIFIITVLFVMFLLAPIFAVLIGLGAAIWIIRTLLLLEKEIKHEDTGERSRTEFVGGEHLFKGEDCFSGTGCKEPSREE
jgi:hypothetical protein